VVTEGEDHVLAAAFLYIRRIEGEVMLTSQVFAAVTPMLRISSPLSSKLQWSRGMRRDDFFPRLIRNGKMQ